MGSPSGEMRQSGSASWRLWPFSSRRPQVGEMSVRTGSSASASASAEVGPPMIARKCKAAVRTLSPTSEELQSLKLRHGRNTITFTFTTRVLGKQQMCASIYLWKWDAQVVISDVDGTITKSDVLGQVMPLVGKDWSQPGVARLLAAIKANGYELMYLSARAISQAHSTRLFLQNLKQGKCLMPEGPVVISPDGLFPSLYREVIRRAPHEFKIACLQDIRRLFPADQQPFYAGFGNRDTDQVSYSAVGIPKGKIFIINPKGEVVVNRSLDHRTYTSLHALVHDIFPSGLMHEREEFNQWNFWRMPLLGMEEEEETNTADARSGSSNAKGREEVKK